MRREIYPRGGVLVEDQEALEDLQLVLVLARTANLVVELLVAERLLSLQTLVRQSRPKAQSASEGGAEMQTTDINCDASSAAG